MKPPKAPAPADVRPAPAPEVRPKPTVTAFALVKREKRWHALALRVRGRELLQETVLRTSEDVWEAESVLTDAVYSLAHHDVDPFAEVPK